MTRFAESAGGDLWTDSQEGGARPPSTFRETRRDGSSAELDYTFHFSIDGAGPAEARNTRIMLRKESGCWKIDDILNASGSVRSMVASSL